MKKIAVIYSPLCEANGAFIGKIYEWLSGQDVLIEVYPFDNAPKEYRALLGMDENCFIDVFYDGKKIDSVPLHRKQLFSALNMEEDKINTGETDIPSYGDGRRYTENEIRKHSGSIQFIPITKDTYREEMTMCLHNYPMGNPPEKYHSRCMSIKERVFSETWNQETVAGIYAKLNSRVIGLLEILPREVIKKYGYMTGSSNNDTDTLTVGCYEVGYGIPRTFMIDELMYHFLTIKDLFSRKYLEGIGIYEWCEGFNPYWVYEKYGFHKTEHKRENIVVMAKTL